MISHICAFGSHCIFSKKSNQVNCICDIPCERNDQNPLCGSDGNTYDSVCSLKQSKCIQQKPINVVKYERCGKLNMF